MSNYCFNQFMVFHADAERMKVFAQAVDTSTLLQTFIPIPDNCDQACTIRQWGTNREVQDGHFELKPGGHNGHGNFFTTWHPPIAAFETLKSQGFLIYAIFYDPTDGFCGRWEDGRPAYFIYNAEGGEDLESCYWQMSEAEAWERALRHTRYGNPMQADEAKS